MAKKSEKCIHFYHLVSFIIATFKGKFLLAITLPDGSRRSHQRVQVECGRYKKRKVDIISTFLLTARYTRQE